jgi:hypothetical protein
MWTAVIDDERAMLEYPLGIEFIRDDAVAWPLDDQLPRMAKYVAKDRKHQKAVDYLQRGDVALHSGDLDKCRYWTERANAEPARVSRILSHAGRAQRSGCDCHDDRSRRVKD